jgi:hypothetical protein
MIGRTSALLSQMLGADIESREEREKGSVRRGLHSGPTLGLFAFDDTNHGGDNHVRISSGFNGIDGRRAGRADIVYNHDASAFAMKAFDAAACAMSLFRFANKEPVEERSVRFLLRAPGAGIRHIADHRIGAEGQPTDRFSVDAVMLKEIEDGKTGKPTTFSIQRCGAAIDIVIARGSGTQRELAKTKACPGEKGEKLFGVHHSLSIVAGIRETIVLCRES